MQNTAIKSLVYVDEKDFEGEEELCNALVSFIGRWKKKKLAECESKWWKEKIRQTLQIYPIFFCQTKRGVWKLQKNEGNCA